jgi:hypothetical protein
MGKRQAWLVALVLFVAACSKQEVPQGEPVEFESSNAGVVGGLSFELPEGWVEEPTSSAMRFAQYRLPGDSSGDAEVAVFANIGGSVEQNVDRWLGQFQKADGSPAREAASVQTRKIGGYNVTLVDVSGTYRAGGMGRMAQSAGPKPKYRMLAAVVEAQEGPWFVKLTGPSDTVEKWQPSFLEYIESVGR